MDLSDIASRGLVILGCGRMGSALLSGWLDAGLPGTSVWVITPNPSDWLKSIPGVHINTELPAAPAVALIAVKPQKMDEALPQLAPMGNGDTLFITVAAGLPLARYHALLGAQTPVVRSMPNTPAAIGRGVTLVVPDTTVTAAQLALAETLMQAVGSVVTLEGEHQMDAAMALSGCGPAYVFHLIESLAAAGTARGLSPAVAQRLALETVAGAGELARRGPEDPGTLRENVTSPKGVTEAALRVLMNPDDGFPALLDRAVGAAITRSEELAQ